MLPAIPDVGTVNDPFAGAVFVMVYERPINATLTVTAAAGIVNVRVLLVPLTDIAALVSFLVTLTAPTV